MAAGVRTACNRRAFVLYQFMAVLMPITLADRTGAFSLSTIRVNVAGVSPDTPGRRCVYVSPAEGGQLDEEVLLQTVKTFCHYHF